MEPDVRRIALVTRRFSGLWGFQSVALGGWLLLLLLQRRFPLLGWLQGYGVLSSSFLVTIVVIRAYYLRRFGRIERRENNRFWWVLWLGTAALVDTITSTRGVPSAFFFTIAALSAGTVARDWPFLTHRIVLVAAALFASFTFAGVTGDETRGTWLRHTVQAVGVALIVAGAGDHRLLATTLRGRKAEADVIVEPIR